MITFFCIWDNLLYEYDLGYSYTTPLRVLTCVILSLLTIPIDFFLLPLEMVAIIIYLLFPGERKDKK